MNQFHSPTAGFASPRLDESEKLGIRIESYKINCSIGLSSRGFTDYFDFRAVTDVSFRATLGRQRWLMFYLSDPLVVDSVFWENGQPARYFRGEKNLEVWVECTPILESGESRTLRFYYHGDILEKKDARFFLHSSVFWYPREGGRSKSGFDLTFRFPSKYMLVSVGNKVSSSTFDDITTERWTAAEPIRNASFNIGTFREEPIHEEGIPKMSVLVSGAGGYKMEQEVADDLRNSVKLFQKLFGPCPVQTLYATEIPFPHGEAFPGLLHLWEGTFQHLEMIEGFQESFRAHEVAHQWWGIGVDFKTYHDQWLSEGFSQYAGMMYMQAALKDNELFSKKLGQMKKSIQMNRKYLFSTEQEAGPISLGYRTESSSTHGDYNLIVYQKGAWVLHMIRMMMLDLKTMSEDRFEAMMRDFYKSYRGKNASTEDFKTVLQKHVKEDMTWFFRQWVYDTQIPQYTFSFTREKLADGKVKVHCRVRQEGVDQDFQMVVPLKIEFAGNRFLRLRARVKGPLSEFDLPPLPLQPDKIIFNDLDAVLCDVESED